MPIKYTMLGLSTLLLALCWLVISGGGRFAASAPGVTFTTITGQTIALQALRGKPVIVTFWATDCPACIREIPHLLELYRRYHPRGLEIIAVAMYYDPPSHVVDMARAKQLPYHVALDLTAQHAHAFGDIQLTPSTFLINPDGKIVLRKTGAFDNADLRARIDTLLVSPKNTVFRQTQQERF